jgi:hypothetical protein
VRVGAVIDEGSIESFLEKPTSLIYGAPLAAMNLPSDDRQEIGWVEVLAH